MDKKRLYCMGILIICTLAFLTGGALADSIKARMKQRLPTIVKLKAQGVVGETSTGYLAYVTAKKVKPNIIEAENKDRKAVYSLIAKQQGVSIERVGMLRAAQIVQKANPGEFLQKPNGTWYKK